MFTSSMISSGVALLDRIAPWLLDSACTIAAIQALLGGQSSSATCKELEGLEDPTKQEVADIRKKIEGVDRELRPLKQLCKKKVPDMGNSVSTRGGWDSGFGNTGHSSFTVAG